MTEYFKTIFSNEVEEFLDTLEDKTREKIIYNVDKVRFTRDPELFKKLDAEIWEFRTKSNGKQYRLLAFWDKRDNSETLVVATHGFVKSPRRRQRLKFTKHT